MTTTETRPKVGDVLVYLTVILAVVAFLFFVAAVWNDGDMRDRLGNTGGLILAAAFVTGATEAFRRI